MRHIITGISALLFTVSLTAAAQDDYSAVEDRIHALAPSANSIAISETPIEGILMVQIKGEIVYTTADGRYLIQGQLTDLDTMENLTKSAKADIRRELMVSIDNSKQISFAPEDPAYELLVFTDIDCGYCRKLHAQINEYNANGIAINYMAFPRAGIGSRSYDKAVSVWCAEDQQGAMTLAKAGSDPDPQQCDNPIAEQYQLGQMLGVTGTPALLTSTGELIPGYMEPAKLRERLDKMASVAAAE